MLRIIGIDPGSESCGMVVLDYGKVAASFNIIYDTFWSKVTNFLIHPECIVVVEDLRPYSTPLTPHVIETAKRIGELNYRLTIEAGAIVKFIPRSDVKKWIFDNYYDIVAARLEKKSKKKAFVACEMSTGKEHLVNIDGSKFTPRKPSFVSIDDKCVMEAMKHHYEIPLPAPGSGYKYGLKDDSWQALAIATLYHTRANQPIS